MDDQQLQPQQPVVYSSMPSNNNGRNKKRLILVIAVFLTVALSMAAFIAVRSRTKDNVSNQEFTASSVEESGVVTITKDGYLPATIKIKQGQSVTWTNQDTSLHQIASDPHPTHSILPDLFSDPIDKDESYTFTFGSTGTYTYHDDINPVSFQGSVIVE